MINMKNSNTKPKFVCFVLFIFILVSLTSAYDSTLNPNDKDCYPKSLPPNTPVSAFRTFSDDVQTQLCTVKDKFIQSGTAAVDGPFGWIWQRGTCDGNSIRDPFQDWLGPAILATLVVCFGAILLYLFGQFMQSPSLIAKAKDAFYEMGITFLRLALVIGVIVAANQWFTLNYTDQGSALVGSPPVFSAGDTIIDSAMTYSRRILFEMTQNYSMLLIFNTIIHTIYSATLMFGFVWRAMFTFNLGPVFRPIIDMIGFSTQFLGVAIGEWMFHLVALCLIKKWTWSLFIPAAILLRAFPATRKAGESLFALTFSLALVYPATFIMNNEIHNMLVSTIPSSGSVVANFINGSGLVSIGALIFGLAILFAGVFFPLILNSALTVGLELMRSSVYYVVIVSLLLPFINIFLTLTSAKELSRFFGIEINFFGFVKLI